MSHYSNFLKRKVLVNPDCGLQADESKYPSAMFPFQRALTTWNLRKGRSALFAGTGLGKSIMQLAWAQQAGPRCIGFAPLAVAKQTVQEGLKWGIPVTYARHESDAPKTGITITNYEMMHNFNPDSWPAVFCDESGILKDFTGKLRNRIIAFCRKIPMRLLCTATPAPNDIQEIANHAEALGVMTRAEMLAHFFVHDDSGWRLKKHGCDGFYRWLASWSMTLSKPSDIGFDDRDYDLPALNIIPHYIHSDYVPEGYLFTVKLSGVKERSSLRKATAEGRILKAAEIVGMESSESWLIWCGINKESDGISRLLKDAINIKGPDSPEKKEDGLLGFASGKHKQLITKLKIAGHGMNFQNAARMMFLGIGDSYEQYYQGIRREWRFGQLRPVDVHIVLSESEQIIYENVLRKEREAFEMQQNLIEHIALFETEEIAGYKQKDDYNPSQEMIIPDWLRSEVLV